MLFTGNLPCLCRILHQTRPVADNWQKAESLIPANAMVCTITGKTKNKTFPDNKNRLGKMRITNHEPNPNHAVIRLHHYSSNAIILPICHLAVNCPHDNSESNYSHPPGFPGRRGGYFCLVILCPSHICVIMISQSISPGISMPGHNMIMQFIILPHPFFKVNLFLTLSIIGSGICQKTS